MKKEYKTNKSINNKGRKKSWYRKDAKFWMMMFIIIIFVSSMLGFALSMSPTKVSSQNDTPLQKYTDKGVTVYYMRFNGADFIFSEDYRDEPNVELKDYANTITNTEIINIHIGEYGDSYFILKKYLDVSGKTYSMINVPECSYGNIVLSNSSIDGECMNLNGNSKEVYFQMEEVVFHLLNR